MRLENGSIIIQPCLIRLNGVILDCPANLRPLAQGTAAIGLAMATKLDE